MANLLDEASILLTPTAYNNGSMLAVKPENGDGDFTFSRNSAATRVNAQGLVENVQILSSNLVSNGDFSQGGQDWTLGSNWSIGDDEATHTGSGSYIEQGSLTQGSNYRVVINVTQASGSGFPQIYMGGLTTAMTSVGTYTFNIVAVANDKIKIRGLNDCKISSVSVIEITDDTNLPRIDYTDGCGSWLMEGQSTNLVPYSSDFSNASWIKHTGIVLTSNQASPDGGNNAYKVQGTIGSSYILDGGFGAITPQSRSIYMRADTNGVVYSLGDSQSNQINVTTEWQRFELQEVSNTIYAVDFRGSGVTLDTVYIWGAQLEQNSYATSYIPTSGATSTRLQDIANNSGNASLINSEEGVLYAETKASVHNGDITLSSGSNNDNLIIRFNLNSGRIDCNMKVAGAYQFIFNYTTDMSINNKIAVRYKANDFALFVNGTKVLTDISGITPNANTFNELNFSSANQASNFFYGKTKALAVFKTALTDAQLTLLTTI